MEETAPAEKPKRPPPTRAQWIVLAVFLLFICGACWMLTRPSTAPNTTDTGVTMHSKNVSAADLGDAWPLTVDTGLLSCEDLGRVGNVDIQAVVFRVNGVNYAINGAASDHDKGIPVDPIWAPDPGGVIPRKNIGPLLEMGLALCQ